jgi:hypothetical protein
MLSYARAEALGLFRLLRTGESAESIRALIGTDTPLRKATRRQFDELYGDGTDQRIDSILAEAERVSQKCAVAKRVAVSIERPKKRKRVQRPCPKKLSPEKLAEVKRQLESGKTWAEVSLPFDVSPTALRSWISWRGGHRPRNRRHERSRIAGSAVNVSSLASR